MRSHISTEAGQTNTEVSEQSLSQWYTGPAGAYAVSASGPQAVGPNNYDCSTWNAAVANGLGPYEYAWSGLFSSIDPSVTGVVPQTGGVLQILVTDSRGFQGVGVISISYDPENTDLCAE